MSYKILFDVTQSKFQHWAELVYALFFAASTVGYLWYKRRSGWRALADGITVFLLFFSLFIGFMFVDCYRDFLSLKSALRESKCAVTEGVITQLTTLTWSKGAGAGESFVVNGLLFSYRAGSQQIGFHQVGVVRNGMQTRIYYLGIHPQIARLEVSP